MKRWYYIIFVILSTCFPKMTCAGTGPAVYADSFLRPTVTNQESVQHAQLFFVQNDTKEKPEHTEKADEERTKGEIIRKEKEDARKQKQLKPFVPTETIPADQAVDFPYDI